MPRSSAQSARRVGAEPVHVWADRAVASKNPTRWISDRAGARRHFGHRPVYVFLFFHEYFSSVLFVEWRFRVSGSRWRPMRPRLRGVVVVSDGRDTTV